MIKSFIFSITGAALLTLGIGFWINNWFLQNYNWLWIAIPSFWVCWQIFSRIFRILDIIIGLLVICAIIYFSKGGITIPWL